MCHFIIPPAEPPPSKGFSLIELLVVLAIIGLLALATVPAFNAIAGGHAVNQTAYDVSGLLEFARTEAVTRQTYVWVGFKNTNVNGNLELQMAAVASRDGSGTNTSAANLMSLSRVLRAKNVSLSKWTDLKSSTRELLTAGQSTTSLSTNTLGVTFQVGANRFDAKNSITFTPRGEALLQGSAGPNDGYDRLIDVSFRQSRGAAVLPEADDAAVIVDGASGTVRTLKL